MCVSDDKTKTFFMDIVTRQNPTACSAGLASLDLMEKEETWSQIRMISSENQEFAAKLKITKIKGDRVKGTILALEINTEEHTHYLNNASENIASYFLKKVLL